MFKLATLLSFVIIGFIPSIGQAELLGKWNVTELVTVKTSGDKQVQVQSQKNQTVFTFGLKRGFLRTDQENTVLSSGSFREKVGLRAFNVGINNKSYSQADNPNSIKAKVQANLAARGINILSFKVKTNKFQGNVFNESVYNAPLPDDVHLIHGAYSYTIVMKVQNNFSERKRYKMTMKIESTFTGVRDTAEDSGSLEWAIENKKHLWPML